jgi:predicted glycosyltransferase
MMDYEYQPANHASFRLADRVVVPEVFPVRSLRRFGAHRRAVRTYEGWKEDLYLAGFEPDPAVLDALSIDRHRLLAVMRPPPMGATYHRMQNERFDVIVQAAVERDVQVVLLPRDTEQAARYRTFANVHVPSHAIDARSLLTFADLAVGAGGTMSREAALLGTPAYTVFAGRLAAVDAELIRTGKLIDLRSAGTMPCFDRRPSPYGGVPAIRKHAIEAVIVEALAELAPAEARG